MKQILISIKPKWVAKILSGEKTLEIRKTDPKCELPLDVYIYCTKSDYIGYLPKRYVGKVVARFTLKNIEEIKYHFGYYDMGDWTESYILEKSCLSADELDNYLQASKAYDESKPSHVYGYAWHISNLEIFDDPKDLEQFDYPNPSGIVNVSQMSIKGLPNKKHPPQSWCYVEENE